MYTWILVFFNVFLKNRNIISKLKDQKLQTMQLKCYITARDESSDAKFNL